MNGKLLFCGLGVLCFTGIQLFAWSLGVDGQVLAFTTSGITTLIGIVAGVELHKKFSKN